MLIRSNLKKLREGKTQNEMAQALNIPQSIYSMAENGKMMLSSDALDRLCTLMKVTPEDIYSRTLLKSNYGIMPKYKNPKAKTTATVRIPLNLAQAIARVSNNRTAFIINAVEEKLNG